MDIKKLTKDMIDQNFIETLEALSEVNMSVEETQETFEDVNSHIYVALMGERIVGTITLLVEKKIIHRGGKAGHIEDVAVHPDFQRKGIGEKIMNYAEEQAVKMRCYKTLLNCSEEVQGFYEKLGYRKTDAGMRKDISPPSP